MSYGAIALLRAWGKQASENDLGTVLQSLWIAREPLVVANLLRVFAARRVPDFDLRLIDLCHSDDSAVRRNAFVAISNIAHSAVRDFALRQLQTSPDDWLVLSLFHRNYRPRYEHLLFEAAELPHAVCEVHWFLMAFIDLLEMNPGADASRLGPLIYFLTPCEHCRFRAFRLLRRRKSDPAWMVRECRADANEECRELANGDSIDPPTEGGAA